MVKEKSKALKDKLQSAVNTKKEQMGEINTYIDFLKGKQYQHKPKKNEVTFNICHTTIQAILNSVLRGNSYIYVDPKSKEAAMPLNPADPGSMRVHQLVEKVVNELWERLGIKYQVELTTTDYAALGLGVSYVDWDYQTDEDGKIVKDEPSVLHIPYEDFLIDPDATTEEIREANFMIRKFIKPTLELKKDSRYKHTKDIKGDIKLSSNIYKGSKEGLERTTLYQIWVLNEGASYVMREGSDDILRTVENKFGREYPFSLMQNYKMPGELMPFGEIKILFEPQKIINQLFSLIMTHANRVSKRQYAANQGISEKELGKLKDAKDGEVLQVEGNQKASDVISVIQDASLSSDVYRAFDLINTAVVQLTNISEYRRSAMPDKQRKATEAAYIEQGTELSISSKAEDIKEHCEDIAKKLFKLMTNEDNINMQEITYKDDKTGEFATESYNNTTFPGVYAFRWESGVEGPLNEITRKQEMRELLQSIATVGSIYPQVIQQINPKALLKSVFAPYKLKNTDEILTPESVQPGMEGMQGMGDGQPDGQPQGMPQGMPQGQVDPALIEEIASKLSGS